MKKILPLIFSVAFLLSSCTTESPKSTGLKILVEGSVEFPEPKFPLQIIYRDGSETIIVDSIPLNPDNSFSKKITLPHAGQYTIDCMKWEMLNFWGENEDILVKFRGQDTAKIKIKNPPFQRIENSGPNNELMNLINFFGYMGYQDMIAAGQEMYQSSQSDSEAWKNYAANGFDKSSSKQGNYINFLAENFADRNSIIALIPQVRDPKVKEALIAKLDQTKADYPPYQEWKSQELEKEQRLNAVKIGIIAPDFSCPSLDGKSNLGPKDFRGKILVMDFWASWCGPCRKVIPDLKEIYAQYKDQGLEILSVSIDSKEQDWKKAIEEEQMTWTNQVLSPNSGKEVLNLYQFNGIPHIVLLDREGKILGKGLTIDQLKEELTKVF